MTEFTASNGITLREACDGERVYLKGEGTANRLSGYDFLNVKDLEALREYFQREDDKKYNRWRSKIDPEWTAVVSKEPERVTFSHADGIKRFSTDLAGNRIGMTATYPHVLAEYLRDNPIYEWHSAKPGEAWLIATNNGEHVYVVNQDATEFINPEFGLDIRDKRIFTATKIHPKGK